MTFPKAKVGVECGGEASPTFCRPQPSAQLGKNRRMMTQNVNSRPLNSTEALDFVHKSRILKTAHKLAILSYIDI
jgi:hypothetical protein